MVARRTIWQLSWEAYIRVVLKFPASVVPKDSLQCSSEPTNGTYPEPHKSTPRPYNVLLPGSFAYYPPVRA